MSINAVQFQAGLSMPDFFAAYGTEAKCYRALYRWRWPQGFRCPCCAGRARSRFKRGGAIYYQCSACRHQTSLIAGTMFQGTKLSLRTWMLALHLLTSTKTNMAALELMRHLGVNYKTAWRMKHKIMQVMAEREATRRLSGFVQIDDAYLGGERNGGKAGRGSENKQPFLIAVQTDASFTAPSFVVIEPVRSFDNAALTDWIARRLKPECEAYTDGLACFRRLETPAMHTPHWTPAADAQPQRPPVPGGSTWCLATSNAPSAASTTPSRKANMRDVIWPKRPTDSIADSACPKCCHDSPRR